MDRRNPFWRSVGSAWAARLVAMLVGIGAGLWLLNYYYQQRIVPDELALGKGTMSATAEWSGLRLNAWQLKDYDAVYPGASATGPARAREVLWLGNSQLHAVNQYKDGDTVAPAFGSEALGRPALALSLPNASLQEHLVVTAWALERRRPEWLVIPVVFDDTREDGLRPDFKLIDSAGLRESLRKSPGGAELAAELEKLSAAEKDSQGTTRSSVSLQVTVENALEGWADRHWAVWANRGVIFSTFLATEVYTLRNRVFGITANSKRPKIPLRYERNMRALRELIARATDACVKVIVYIPPLRRDIDPPYFLDQYAACKTDTEAAAREARAYFLDLEGLVPAEFWGERYGDIDFMHFQVGGHRLMGAAIAEAIRRAESDQPAPSAPPGGAH